MQLGLCSCLSVVAEQGVAFATEVALYTSLLTLLYACLATAFRAFSTVFLTSIV